MSITQEMKDYKEVRKEILDDIVSVDHINNFIEGLIVQIRENSNFAGQEYHVAFKLNGELISFRIDAIAYENSPKALSDAIAKEISNLIFQKMKDVRSS